MTAQLTLLDWSPAARNSDPDTSHRAAQRAAIFRNNDQWRVLIAHAEHPYGITDFELESLTDIRQTSGGKRRGELRDLGYIADSGKRRPAPSGSPAIVWKITSEGLAMARTAA